MRMNEKQENEINTIEKKLIVSCQALEQEPLHSSFIMGRMAKAAREGGACGIRANTIEDILEIQKNVDLPIIGIIKRDYVDSNIYITPTMKEIDDLVSVGTQIIALDATCRLRPNHVTIDEFFASIKAKYPNQKWMADCSTIEEAIHADELGFDYIGTTLVGYTKESQGMKIEEDDFYIIRTILSKVKGKVIAEGNIDRPDKARRVIELGCHSVVVGGAITRPQLITKKFSDALTFE